MRRSLLTRGLHTSKVILNNNQQKSPLINTRGGSVELPHPNLDYNTLFADRDALVKNSRDRAIPLTEQDADQLIQLHQDKKRLEKEANEARQEQRSISKSVQNVYKNKQRNSKEGQEILEKAGQLKKVYNDLTSKAEQVSKELHEKSLRLPNYTHPSVPIGSYNNAKIVKTTTTTTTGSKTKSDLLPPPFNLLDVDSAYKEAQKNGNQEEISRIKGAQDPNRHHMSKNMLSGQLEWIDLHGGAKTTGSSWVFLKQTGALLENALIQYTLSKTLEKGFIPIFGPDVVKSELVNRCGFAPRDGEAHQTYFLTTDNHPHHHGEGEVTAEAEEEDKHKLALSGTAEIPLAGYCHSCSFAQEYLPLKFVSLGRAFRAEAGARGRESGGLYRVHQFSKVEMFALCMPEQSDQILQDLVDLQYEILSELGLPLRVLDMPTEELGASAYRKYDIEAWMPGRGSWGELASASNCTDYQSRRLSIRWRGSNDDKLKYLHTLNATAAAIPRLIIALIENGMMADSNKEILLPRSLERFWLGSKEHIQFS